MHSYLHQLLSALDPQRLRNNLLQMVDIYSPSGKEEDIQRLLAHQLRQAGSRVRLQPVSGRRHNVEAIMGRGKPRLYFVGHVDTVPAWDLEDYRARMDGDTIHGLGTSDMKGGCAAMLEAWLGLMQLPPEQRPHVGLIFVVDEEENGDGANAFLRHRRPDWAIIGEPTSLAACFAHYGYLEVGLHTRGTQTHSSLPELGHNAIASMLKVLLQLEDDRFFDRKRSGAIYSIRELSSSQAGFVIPDRCEAWLDLHLPPGIAPAAVKRRLRHLVGEAAAHIPDLNLHLEFDTVDPGYDLGRSHRLGRILEDLSQELELALRYDAFRSHSDANKFHTAGVKPLVLGPGSLETAHTPYERTSFEQVWQAARLYAGLALEVAAPAGLAMPKAS